MSAHELSIGMNEPALSNNISCRQHHRRHAHINTMLLFQAGAGAVPGGAQRAPSAAADSGSYLPMSQEVLAGVQAEFAALDGDRDGYVQVCASPSLSQLQWRAARHLL